MDEHGNRLLRGVTEPPNYRYFQNPTGHNLEQSLSEPSFEQRDWTRDTQRLQTSYAMIHSHVSDSANPVCIRLHFPFSSFMSVKIKTSLLPFADWMAHHRKTDSSKHSKRNAYSTINLFQYFKHISIDQIWKDENFEMKINLLFLCARNVPICLVVLVTKFWIVHSDFENFRWAIVIMLLHIGKKSSN